MWWKTIKLVPRYFMLSIQRTSEFKFSMYTYVSLYILQIIFFILFWKGVQPPTIRGWTIDCYYLLTGFATLNASLQEIVWATGMLDLAILRGDLNVVLVRPENSYFSLVCRRLGAMALLPAAMGFLTIILTLINYHHVELIRLSIACFCCLCAAIILRALMVIVCSFSFKFGKVKTLKAFILNSKELSRYPLNILHPLFTASFIFFFPVMLVSTWPTMILRISENFDILKMLLMTLFLTAAWVSIASWSWKYHLKHYEGYTG